jgi:hypothetical protein
LHRAKGSKILFTEALGTTPEKKIIRPINPVNSDAAGKYVIELVKAGSAPLPAMARAAV